MSSEDEIKSYGLAVVESDSPEREEIDFSIEDGDDNVAWVWGTPDKLDWECNHPYEAIEFGDRDEQGECLLCGAMCDWHLAPDENTPGCPEPHEWYINKKLGGMLSRYVKEQYGSKLEVSEKLRTYSSCQRKVLEWMLEHPKMLHNTNASKLTKAIGLTDGIRMTEESIRGTITRMFHREILFKRGTRFRFDVFFNFQHHNFPQDLVERYAKNIEHDGPVTTLAQGEPGGKSEEEPTERTIVDVDRETREEIAESGAPGTEESAVETVCPEPITVKADNGEMKLSITLNINITR